MTLPPDQSLAIDLHGGKRPERFCGTPAEIVRVMRATAFCPAQDEQAYMAEFARYSKMIDGRAIRSASAEVFIADLLALGIAERIEEDAGTVPRSGAPASG